MATQKHFLQDRTALLLTSGMSFLLVVLIVLILLQLGSGHHSAGFIVQCRDCSNSNYIDRFTSGTLLQIISFIVFGVVTYGISLALSYKVHGIKRELSYCALGLTMALLIFASVVAYSLLTSA